MVDAVVHLLRAPLRHVLRLHAVVLVQLRAHLLVVVRLLAQRRHARLVGFCFNLVKFDTKILMLTYLASSCGCSSGCSGCGSGGGSSCGGGCSSIPSIGGYAQPPASYVSAPSYAVSSVGGYAKSGYSAPVPSYSAPAPTYSAPAPSYNGPSSYSGPAPSYNGPSSGYGNNPPPPPNYGSSPPPPVGIAYDYRILTTKRQRSRNKAYRTRNLSVLS